MYLRTMLGIVLALILAAGPHKPAVLPNDTAIVDSRESYGDDAIGNVLVTFTDGHREKWTRRGQCMMPLVSDSGLVGWARVKMRFDDGAPLSPAIRIGWPDGHFKDIDQYESDSYLVAWCFAENDHAIVIESSPGHHEHGPSHYMECDLRTGKIMRTAVGDCPPWAQALPNP
jgi:hypothetical protein